LRRKGGVRGPRGGGWPLRAASKSKYPMMDPSTATGLGMGRAEASAPSSAPLDRLVYETGDLSKLPVVPHSLSVRRLLHADSNLLRGRVPGNVTQKDFIRRGESLRPRDVLEQTLRVKPVSTRPRPASSFGQGTALAEESLWREVQRVKAAVIHPRAGAARAGAGACGAALAADADAAAADAEPAGPPEHPSVVLESEGVRAGMAPTGALARMLAQRPGAPTTASPAPAHHFMSGGTRAQLRKEQRRAINQEKLREANLDLRKDQLVARNLEVLEQIAAQQQDSRDRAEALMAFAAGGSGTGAGSELKAGAAIAAAPKAAPPATVTPKAAAAAAPKRFQPAVAAAGGFAVVLLAAALAVGTAAVARRARNRAA
jgi:hypothetical protein